MSVSITRLFVVLSLPSLSRAVVYDDLGEDNFERLVFKNSKGAAFVKFYAPWCGHCQKLAPDWRKLEKEYRTSKLLVGSVDCSDGPAQPGGQGGRNPLCDKYKAMSLPTLMFFEKPSKKGFTYEGNKTADDLLAFAQNLASSCSLSTQDECTDEQKQWLAEYGALPTKDVKDKATDIVMKQDMQKFRMMMTQMQMQEEYPKLEKLPKAEKDKKMKVFEDRIKETGKDMDETWTKMDSLRAMRMVLAEKDLAALKEVDDFDAMAGMMGAMGGGAGSPLGGGGGGGGGGAPPKKAKKKKKKKKSTKDEV